jgi:hypothetical protein
MFNRNFARLLMMGVFSRNCSGVLWGCGSLQCRVLVGDSGSFFKWVVSGMGREGDVSHGVRVMFTSCRNFKTDQILCIYVLYYMFLIFDQFYILKQSLQWWSASRRIFFYVSDWSVEVYVPQVPHQEAVEVFGYTYVSCERYT